LKKPSPDGRTAIWIHLSVEWKTTCKIEGR
jgi:hypothetical protein